MHLVVARYNENIDWISELELPFTIYNKGTQGNIENSIKIPNVGRESETYLRYIKDNYYNLPETVVFLQGDPFPHCRTLVKQLKRYENEPVYYLGNELIFDFEDGSPHHPGLNIAEIAKLLGIYKGSKKYYFVPGAQFIVKSSTIKNRSIDWWINAYNVHNKFYSSPWVYERFWNDIFTI